MNMGSSGKRVCFRGSGKRVRFRCSGEAGGAVLVGSENRSGFLGSVSMERTGFQISEAALGDSDGPESFRVSGKTGFGGSIKKDDFQRSGEPPREPFWDSGKSSEAGEVFR